MDEVVVVGAGHAGVQVADSLRTGGWAGPVTVLDTGPELPYQRPPLSKEHLAPDADPEPLPLRAASFFRSRRIDLRTGVTVTGVNRGRGIVSLDDGTDLGYDTLVLATGAAPRSIAVPGRDLAGVHELRTLADARQLGRALRTARSVVVVGAGFIGLEFAAAARRHGVGVVVLEAAPLPLGRATSTPMAEHLALAHRHAGTELRLGVGLAALTGHDGRVTGAVGSDGREVPADIVVLGVGVVPRDGLARRAGLAVEDGILVDETLRTADPAVYAVGDGARFRSATGTLRLESVQNATDQARHVADAIMSGRPAAYRRVPWFWSHQGPLKLQIAGLTSLGDTTAIVGDPAGGRFSVLSFRKDRLVAVESLNRPADHLAARRLLTTGTPTSPRDAADPAFTLTDHAARSVPVRQPIPELR